jgi:hypothetical protein
MGTGCDTDGCEEAVDSDEGCDYASNYCSIRLLALGHPCLLTATGGCICMYQWNVSGDGLHTKSEMILGDGTGEGRWKNVAAETAEEEGGDDSGLNFSFSDAELK